MEFANSERSLELQDRLRRFMDARVIPAEAEYQYESQLAALTSPHGQPAIMEELKAEARELGLWNVCIPHEPWGLG